jgi:hypothetical protein
VRLRTWLIRLVINFVSGEIFRIIGLEIPSPFDTEYKENTMARHTNPLLKVLLEDNYKRNTFIELINDLGSARYVMDYLNTNGFLGEKYGYFSSQTVRGIIRRLGIKSLRGRNPKINTSRQRYSLT